MDSPTKILSEHVAKVKFEDIPKPVVEMFKDLILDSMGVVIGGSVTPPGEVIVKLFSEMGGQPEASILATGKKVPVLHAAYVNSFAGNMLDFDDNSDAPDAHPGETIIPPGLALAEKIEASGKDLITAVAVAYEVWAHIGQAMDWYTKRKDQVFGLNTHQTFGAAVVCSKLLGFNAEQVATTIGLAGVNAPIPSARKFVEEYDGQMHMSWVKNNYGWASKGGMLAAILTDRGIKGNQHFLDGEKGFWIMASSDHCDFERMISGLGSDFLTSKTGIKRYAACRLAHSTLDAVEEIMSKHKVDVNKIKSIKVETQRDVIAFNRYHNPPTLVESTFSLPHLVALELLGRSSRKGLSEADLSDPKVRSLDKKVSVEISKEIDDAYIERKLELFWSAIVTIEQTDGKVFSERVDRPKWGFDRWPSKEEVHGKFMQLTSPIIGISAAEDVIQNIEQLEAIEDASTIIPKIGLSNT